MKKLFTTFILLGLTGALTAQVSYTTSYVTNGGNPGALNTDNDDVTLTWNVLIGGSISSNQWSASVPLPFTFNFFGSAVTSFRASANGLVTFNSGTLPVVNNNTDLPGILPDKTIACFWEAFTSSPPTQSNDIVAWQVWGTAPNRQLWIKWASFEMGAPPINATSFACVLEETSNNIYMVEGFAGGTPLLTTTSGLVNNSTQFLQYGNSLRPQTVNSSQTATDNDYVVFAPYNQTNMTVSGADNVQPSGNITRGTTNEGVMRIVIETSGELSPLSATAFDISLGSTTSASDIVQAKLFYNGNDSALNTQNQFGSTVNNPSLSGFTFTGTQLLKPGKNYFWLTYTLSPTATATNIIDAACTQITVGSSIIPANINPIATKTITAGLSGVVTVGASGTYATLSDAATAINTQGLEGPLTLSIISDITETSSAVFNYQAGNSYPIQIVPSAAALRTISFNSPTWYLKINGSRNITIDGSFNGGKYLRFINTDVNSGVINFSNGARFDTIRNCIIEGASTSQTIGVIHLDTSAGSTTGNRDLVIQYNDLRDISSTTAIPTILIYSSGTTTLVNSNISIIGNNLFNFRRSGVYVTPATNGGGWVIDSNHFYYNASTNPQTGDIVPVMLIPGINANNNSISYNYFGGTAPFCGGGAWVSPNSVNFVVMNVNTGITIGTSVQGNTIQNINMTTTGVVDFAGIRNESGRMEIGNINGNTIGHPTTPNSIVIAARLTLCIYAFTSSLGELIIANNTIANVSGTGTTTSVGVRGISVQGGAAIPNIYNNTIYNLSSSGATTSALTTSLMGIGLNSGNETFQPIVRNNLIYNLSATAASANTVPTGIVIDHGGANGIVENNTIYNITNASTGATASIAGIHIAGGIINWNIRNNMISITNGSNTNSMLIRGISDNASANSYNLQYNTIRIGGNANAGAANSYAYDRRTTSTPTLRNNIFYNERTGGTGIHAAIAQTGASTNWTTSTSDYNLLVAGNAANMGVWSASLTPNTINNWRTTTNGDLNSWAETTAAIPSATFFKNTAIGDLRIDELNPLCWFVNGKGIALSGIGNDKENTVRSTTILNGSTDIGADEFTTNTAPPTLTISGNILVNDSSMLSMGNRIIAKVYWTGGALPTTISGQYFSGESPASILSQGGSRMRNYLQLNTTGSNSYTCNVKIYYDSAMFGDVSKGSDIVMASSPGTPAFVWSTHNTSVDGMERSFMATGFTDINQLFTGTDVDNPLPITLTRFTAVKAGTDVHVKWETAHETNTKHFEVLASVDGHTWRVVGKVNAAGNSAVTKAYNFNHINPFTSLATKTIYYQLKSVDLDGTSSLSDVVRINSENAIANHIMVYPNPINELSGIYVSSDIDEEIKVSIYNQKGEQIGVYATAVIPGTNKLLQTELSNLPSGLYLIHVQSGNATNVIRVCK